MGKAPDFSVWNMRRALKALKDEDISIGEVDILPDGTVKILTLAGAEQQRPTPFQEWKQKRGGHAA